MKLELQEYKARKIVNVHKHVDGPWFWDKYSAHPYIGCRSGCEKVDLTRKKAFICIHLWTTILETSANAGR